VSRRTLHILVALILLACAVSPFVESALHCHDTILSTGQDGESTVAVVVLLLELVLSLTSLLIFLCPNLELKGRLDTEFRTLTTNIEFGFTIPELSPPVPVRI
jgi:hypothetical protein